MNRSERLGHCDAKRTSDTAILAYWRPDFARWEFANSLLSVRLCPVQIGAASESFDLGGAPPVLPGTNNRNCLDLAHIEKIAIDADQ
jgi:hypothetical protein